LTLEQVDKIFYINLGRFGGKEKILRERKEKILEKEKKNLERRKVKRRLK